MDSKPKVLAAAVTLALGMPQPGAAATITVNSLIDEFVLAGSPTCTLRLAVIAANDNAAQAGCQAGDAAGVDQIVFDPALTGGTVTLSLGEIRIGSSVTIEAGAGSRRGIVVSGANESRIFRLDDFNAGTASEVTLRGLVLRYGFVDGGLGGAVINQGENLTIENSTLVQNTASTGGAIHLTAGAELNVIGTTLSSNTATEYGGAVYVRDGGEATVADSILTGNEAERGGGLAVDGTVTLQNATVRANTATTVGGGVYVLADGSLSMVGGALLENHAQRGGGLYQVGPAEISGATVADNIATYGGGIYSREVLQVSRSTLSGNSAENGAALFTLQMFGQPSEVLLENVTVSANSSVLNNFPPYPAAVYSFSAISITNSTFVDNAPNGITKANGVDSWSMVNTIIAGSAEADCVDAVTPMDTNLNNLFEDGSCAGGAIGLTTGPPLLGPLADNGGGTPTHSLLSGSPAVDAGVNAGCPSLDQTGMPRPIDGNADSDNECDVGSVEFVDLFGPVPSLTSAPDVTSPGGNTYDLTVTYSELDGEIDLASIGMQDITVLPGPLTVQSTALSGSSSQLSVTYVLQPPGGSWDFSDGGTYTVSVNPDQVTDIAVTGANSAAAGEIGEFQVLIAEIDVSGNGASIADGDDAPSTVDGSDFGNVPVGQARSRTFVVRNIGNSTLNLTSPVDVLGQGFSVSQPGDTELSQGESTSFDVTLTPAAAGPVAGTVTVVNSDPDEGVFSFSIAGLAVAASDLIFTDDFEEP